jgi:ABC-type phosphate/phosphonate transport system permease subunit
MTEDQKPVAWRYIPSEVWRDYAITEDESMAACARAYGRDVEPLYTRTTLDAALAQAVAAERTATIDRVILAVMACGCPSPESAAYIGFRALIDAIRAIDTPEAT